RPEVDVAEGERGHGGAAGVDLARGEVDADELCGGEPERHRDQVAADAAAELEDAAAIDGGWGEAVEAGDSGEDVGMGADEGAVVVGDGVVRRGRSRIRHHRTI